MSKRSPEDILKDIEDSEVDDQIDRILAMSAEERRRELEAAGADVGALHAKADALHAQIQQAAPAHLDPSPAKVSTLPARSRLAIWLIAAALGVMLVVMATGGGGGVSRGRPRDATELRDEAYAACDAHRWRECGEKLDQAKQIDPKGESDPRVVEARRAVKAA